MNYRFLCVISVAGFLSACATTPPPAMQITGNGGCHPSQALPSHKDVPKLPEIDTAFQAFFNLFVDERKQHGQDVRDYNTLWDECVGTPKP